MKVSPKYIFGHAYPVPSAVSTTGNTITWSFSGLSSDLPKPTLIDVSMYRPLGSVPLYMPGDTVNSNYLIDPVAGDADPADNQAHRVDTIRSSYDPNFVEVSPAGYIPAGTELTYTIGFENTGNDTAHNIFVLDTLSNYLDAGTFQMVAASHQMNIFKQTDAPFAIVKFDFPDIMLPDSTHHDHCHGLFVYKIKTKVGLSNGTIIPCRAGIYFDTNPVVMTNTANDIIGIPVKAASLVAARKVNVYPNPATSELTVSMTADAFSSCTISNTVGQVLLQHQLTDTQTKIDIKALPDGLYYITLKGDSETVVKKFVKK